MKHTNTYRCVRTINEKEAIKLKKSKGSVWEGVNGETAGRGSDLNVIIVKNKGRNKKDNDKNVIASK